MKKLLLFLLLITALFKAQNQRFSYEYEFVKDTLNKEDITKELMFLDIGKEGSTFYSRDVYLSDSTINAYYENQIKNTGSMNVDPKVMSQRKGSVLYKILKNYPDFKIFSLLNMGMDAYKISEERTLVWTILPEVQKIGQFSAQKATTEFAGRRWTAWFSAELPFQDGPYKFHGLPGLIVKIEDLTQTHHFELVGVSKFTPNVEKISPFAGENKEIEINHKQYKKLFLEERNDPAKVIRQAVANGAILQFTDPNGTIITPTDLIKKREQSAKSNNAKNNNILEIDLLQ